MESSLYADAGMVLLALFIVFLNGFFVAAEFSLVKIRGSRVQEMVREGRTFAKTARWLFDRLEGTLSACQLGITLASLALGWVGEPAFARILEPLFHKLGLGGTLLHTVSFLIAFSISSALHLVVGEQVPKIYAIRQSETTLLWCSVPMKWFYLGTYPFMVALNSSTSMLLSLVGIEGGGEHDTPHSEEEIRGLLREAHIHGNLSRNEHHLLDAVFEFDDQIVRRIMVPRNEVEFLDINLPPTENMALAQRTKHTRYPVCDGSLDKLLGVVHVKDLVGIAVDENFDFTSIMRPPRKIPEDLPCSKVLRYFQASHQLMSFVIDEYGIVLGIVTLENVLEQIIGPVDDEFDTDDPDITPDGPGHWVVRGSASLPDVLRVFTFEADEVEADTFSGFLTHKAERLLNPGDHLSFADYEVEVLEVRNDRVYTARIKKLETAVEVED